MEPIPLYNHRHDAAPLCFWIIVVCKGLFANTEYEVVLSIPSLRV